MCLIVLLFCCFVAVLCCCAVVLLFCCVVVLFLFMLAVPSTCPPPELYTHEWPGCEPEFACFNHSIGDQNLSKWFFSMFLLYGKCNFM